MLLLVLELLGLAGHRIEWLSAFAGHGIVEWLVAVAKVLELLVMKGIATTMVCCC
ncbi:hypothetical protein U1Q18_006991 [Sarracenia purpurea var. burkii]